MAIRYGITAVDATDNGKSGSPGVMAKHMRRAGTIVKHMG
jgi:hypothetical protein